MRGPKWVPFFVRALVESNLVKRSQCVGGCRGSAEFDIYLLTGDPLMIHARFARLALVFAFAAGFGADSYAATPAASAASTSSHLDLKDPKQRTSYAIGTGIGNSFKNQDVAVDPSAVAAGIADAIAGKLAMSEAEIQTTMEQVRSDLAAKQQAKLKTDGASNAKAGADYLAANKTKPGVKTTASGLQYKVIKSGTGKTPGPNDTVKVHYHGTLIDGTVFDSSVARGEPVTFPVKGVIPGWTEVLQLMKEGDKWQVYIPPQLAYGEAGAGGKIGPNSVLVFDIELIDVEK
jgi:FKBP-type peptidyl-prolyl cis-trans isomerase FklB